MATPSEALRSPDVPDPVRAELDHANALRAEQAWEEAAREYRAVLAAHPRLRDARRGLIATLIAQGKTGEALPLLDQLLRDEPDDLESWRDRVAIYRTTAEHAQLLHSLQAVERLAPHDRSARFEECRLLEVTGSPEEAYRCLELLLRERGDTEGVPTQAQLQVHKAELAEALGRPQEAQSAYGEAVASDEPETVRVAALGGARLAVRTGRPDLALTLLTAAIPAATTGSQAPRDLLTLRAEILLQVDRPEEAQEIYDQLRAKDPSDAVALAGAARARIEQGKHPEAREILHEGLRTVPRSESLVLALAEAESGSGDLLAAERAVREGLELLPSSRALWTRLAEIASARNAWEVAAESYEHAIALAPDSVDGVLGAAFVAEQRGQPEEALRLYDRAGTLAPGDVRVWTRRGSVLASLKRHHEAIESFDRALGIDPESDAAREGKKVADRERRTRETDVYGVAALRLESQLGRPITKNDLFVQLKVPFDQLDPVLAALSREEKADVATLEPAAFADLEARSCRLITAALERRPPGVERRGLTVADVAALAGANDSLADVQRLFAYVDTVLRMDIRPENLRLTPQAEEVARRALTLPLHQRTLFGLVRTLQIGIFQARVVKAVERASDSAHPPLPAVNLASHSPEFGGADEHADGAQFFSPENVPVASPGSRGATRTSAVRHSKLFPLGVPPLETQRAQARDRGTPRCIACGGIAAFQHGCGAALCVACTRQFGRCPKCGGPLSSATASPPLRAPPVVRPAPVAPPPPARAPRPVAILPHEAGVTTTRAKAPERPKASPPPAEPARATETKPKTPPPRRPDVKREEARPLPAPKASPPADADEEEATAAPPPAPPPRLRRDKPDDEPRL